MTLDQLAQSQPGMARLMPEVGVRVWKAWYAAQALNWPLARFQLREAVKLMELSAFVRPKYERSMARFLADDFAPLSEAVESADWPRFERSFEAMVERANHYHDVFNKGFLRWKLPDSPPQAWPGRPSIWRTLAFGLSLGNAWKRSVVGSKRMMALAPKSVSQTMSLSST